MGWSIETEVAQNVPGRLLHRGSRGTTAARYPEFAASACGSCSGRRKGFSLQKIRRVLRFLQKDTGKRLSEALSSVSDLHLLTDGESIYLEEAPDRIIDLLKNASQPFLLICLTDQARRLSAALRASRAASSLWWAYPARCVRA
jgi:hypothetical protein